jgi:hypothetical protein
MTAKTTLAASLLAMAFLALTACSSTGNSAQTLPTTANNPMVPPAAQPEDHQGCSNNGDLRVNPCRITFDSGNPGPVDVTVSHGGRDGRNDGDRHRITERDNCASRNIATITSNSQHLYTVTAGTASGSCTANFDDNGNGRGRDGNDDHGGGGRNGGSQLRIVNNL